MSQSTHLVSVLEAAATTASTRIYPIRAPQDATTPFVVYTEVSIFRPYSHDGTNASRPRWQIDCWADSVSEARTLAGEVRTALEGIDDTSGSETYRGGFLDNEQEFYDDDARLYRVRADYLMWHEEAA